MVADDKHQPLIGATIRIEGEERGTVSDVNGQFQIEGNTNDRLVISFVGYASDTITFSDGPLHVMLSPASGELDAITVSSGATFFDELEPRHNEIITSKELLKAACCNLSESFETNASVDVSFTDAVSGAKMIRMLGLDGRYVLINRENVPHVRGLSGRYGLGFVPGTWIQSIDVGKGAGTVVNGYESMTGQINVEFKKPENSEKLYLNTYLNSFGRMELNVNTAQEINDRLSTALLVHGNYLNTEIDRNNDGFLDIPKSRQFNVMNRYKFEGDRVMSQVGFHFMRDEKTGGQTGFDFGDNLLNSAQYGFVNNTTRMEVFGKVGLLFLEKPYKGWGFIYSATYQDIDGGFGRRDYSGEEKTIYANLINQNIIGNSFHQFKTGASLLIDDFDEVFADSAFSRTEIVPGAFYEYSFLPGDNFSLIAGFRADLHNLYGLYLTPRLHVRYQLSDPTTLRASIGKGYRTPNVIVENSAVLVSSRQLIIEEDPDPEEGWNMGGSLVNTWILGGKDLSFVIDYFYTAFENQMIYDMDRSSSQLRIYNLDGRSFAHSFQAEASYSPITDFTLKTAYKYYNVRATINGELRPLPYVSRDRFFLNASYATKYDKWKADATLQWFSKKRLPRTDDKSIEYQRDPFSPDFFLVNAQVSRGFRWGSIYLGSENLLDFRQDDPIIDPDNPFGNNFDASIVWGPIAGRVVYAGIRYQIKK